MKAQLPQKTIILLFSILLSACSGGSSSSSNNGDTDLSPGTAGISGDVIDAISGAPIPTVLVSVDGLPQSSLSDSGGEYQLGSLPNDMAIDVRFSLDGYVSEVYRTPLLNSTPETSFNQLDTVMLVPDNNMGVGGADGTISDSQGNLLAGAVLRFLTGINAIEGIAAATTVTDSQGFWTITGLDAGNYTCIIEIEGRDPVFETVQIVGGVENVNADVVVPVNTRPQINFPPTGTRNDYNPGEVAWDYSTFNYDAISGQYSVDARDRTGAITLIHFGFDQNPLNYRDSTVFIVHTFAGAGNYSIVGSSEKVREEAEANQPSAVAYVRVIANGPIGTVGFDRFNRYITRYEPPSDGGSGISVSIDTSGRYVFEIGNLELTKSPNQFDDVHPDAPNSIRLNLSNGNAP